MANCSRLLISLFSSSSTDSGVAMSGLVCVEPVTAVEVAMTGTLFIVGAEMLAAVVNATVAVVETAVMTGVGVVFGAMGHPLGKRATATPG